jgi:hypothetical protein
MCSECVTRQSTGVKGDQMLCNFVAAQDAVVCGQTLVKRKYGNRVRQEHSVGVGICVVGACAEASALGGWPRGQDR